MDIKKNVGYLCKSEELAKEFLKECKERGVIWNDGKTSMEETNWALYKEKTCYCFDVGNIYTPTLLFFDNIDDCMNTKDTTFIQYIPQINVRDGLENDIKKLESELDKVKLMQQVLDAKKQLLYILKRMSNTDIQPYKLRALIELIEDGHIRILDDDRYNYKFVFDIINK